MSGTDDGWENAVVQTADGWMLRFPRRDGDGFAREIKLLSRLAARLPVPIPRIAWTGRLHRFAAYRALTGSDFSRPDYLAAPEKRRDALATSLAEFLVAMHGSLTGMEANDLGVPLIDPAPMLDVVVAGMDRVPVSRRASVTALVEAYARTWAVGGVPGGEVVLHNDFHPGNMVFTEPAGVLAGVWDFSCVARGVPTFDLRYFANAPRDLLDRLAARYEALTDRPMSVPSAIVANRVEDVHDAIETGRADLFEAAFARWDTTDRGS